MDRAPAHRADLPGIAHRPGWLSQPDATDLFDVLLETLPWQLHRIRIFLLIVDSPRQSC